MGRRAQLSSKAHAGKMQHLKLAFPAVFSPNPRTHINQMIQILDQLCEQYKEAVPALAWKPLFVTSRELRTIVRTKRIRNNLTQKGDILVIHAGKETSGKRYTLQAYHDCSKISLAVAGSRTLYDLFIDTSQDGNVLVSHKALLGRVGRKKLMELQLATMPSGYNDSDNFMYYLSYKQPLKSVADRSLIKAMQAQLRQISLTPDLYVGNDDRRIQKITGVAFEKMFGVKLLQVPSVDKDVISDIKDIGSSYRRLQPYLDGQLEYDAGIKSGSLQDVSQKSLLEAILAQVRKKQRLPKAVIVKVNDLVGYGLIAGQYIPAGTVIGEYCGEISKVAAPDKANPDNTYFAAYAPDAIPGSEMFVADARKSGNSTRFINHSEENANASWLRVFDGKMFRSVIAAVKPIPQGKQILLKYKDSYWLAKKSPGNPCPL